ncbi:MAG TPA: GtrA family protein [Porphyromonadaceae bacterium]|nr:GtrA family protein [Porphyromonadaceae bacterium]
MLKQILIFTKAQVSAFVGGVIDYLLMVFFTEVFGLHYLYGIVIGGVCGAVINFSLNKKWTFHSQEEKYESSTRLQLIKFSATATNSILLKSLGTFLLTTFLGINYKITRLAVDLFVSVGFNYMLQKTWVFKKRESIYPVKKQTQLEVVNDFFRKKRIG